MATIITTKKCSPFLLRVMVFSPDSGYKFNIDIQKACTSANDEVWKLLFDLHKKNSNDGSFTELVSVEFVAGDPNDIDKVAVITDQGMTHSQVKAFKDDVFPLIKPFADNRMQPTDTERTAIDDAIRKAVNS